MPKVIEILFLLASSLQCWKGLGWCYTVVHLHVLVYDNGCTCTCTLYSSLAMPIGSFSPFVFGTCN
jgi:hypothetical protein